MKMKVEIIRKALQDYLGVCVEEPSKQPITVSDGRDELNRELDQQDLDLDEFLMSSDIPSEISSDFSLAVQDLSQELKQTLAQETDFDEKTKIPMPPQDLSGQNIVDGTPDVAKQPMTVRPTQNFFFPEELDLFEIQQLLEIQ